MEQDIFNIQFDYRRKIQSAEIRTKLPEGPGNDPHEVWIDGKYQFTIQPNLDECYIPCWKLIPGEENKKIDPALINSIADTIEEHYL